jgi:RNA polymerase sigma-70 factor (ECF subfamily)
MTKGGSSQQLPGVALEAAQITAAAAPAETEGCDCLALYRAELDYLIGSLRRLGVLGCDIDDVLHEVFLVMLRRWDDFDRSRPPRPWLFGIAFRVASGHRRRNQRELLSESYEAEDPSLGPEEATAAVQGRRLLLRALSAIPLERRAVLILHEVDEVAMKDIAQHLSIPLFTAYSRLRKARRELDAALVRLLNGGRDAR